MAESCFICGTPRPTAGDCPRCGAPADIGIEPRRGAGWRARVLRWLLALGAAACAGAWLLIVGVHVESVVGTGPLIALLGVATLTAGRRWRNPWAATVGAGHLGICLLFFGLVNLLSWSPGQAHEPFAWMGLTYTLAVAAPTFFAWRQGVPAINPWACAHCSYLLVGIREPRCPECGEPVDSLVFERIVGMQRRAAAPPEPPPEPAPVPGPPSLFASGCSMLLH